MCEKYTHGNEEGAANLAYPVKNCYESSWVLADGGLDMMR